MNCSRATATTGRTGPVRTGQDWLCRLHALPDSELASFEHHLTDGLKDKTAFACELLDQQTWDLFLIVFKEAHCMGHQAWDFLDSISGAPSLPPHKNPVMRMYQALDSAIGEIARRAGPETSLIVFSDLGMGPHYTGEHLLDEVLKRLETKIATFRQQTKLAARGVKEKLRRLISPGDESTGSPANRLAFQLEHNEMSGAIRINLAGREPPGMVMPGPDYERICSLLEHEFLALRIPETGEPLVEAVYGPMKPFRANAGTSCQIYLRSGGAQARSRARNLMP